MKKEGNQKEQGFGTSLVVQWLRHHASSAGDMVSNPGQGTQIPHISGFGQKKKVNRVLEEERVSHLLKDKRKISQKAKESHRKVDRRMCYYMLRVKFSCAAVCTTHFKDGRYTDRDCDSFLCSEED